MILVDANLLLYATVSDFEQHAAARAWLDDRLNAPTRVGLPWPSVLAFLRIITNPRIFPRPLAMTAAWRRVVAWLDLPTVWVPEPTERHREILDSLLGGAASASKLVADAHLAAIAVGHGLVLCSTDGDFARFAALRWENPLAA
ncbi:PIN domain-containing protein [bacterium]|nr:PIN domain-containing protein [bacterium]